MRGSISGTRAPILKPSVDEDVHTICPRGEFGVMCHTPPHRAERLCA